MAKKTEINLEDIPGVGEKTLEKLKSIGYSDPMVIAVSSPTELANIAEIGEATAAKIISVVREKLDIGYETADKILEKRTSVAKITTGSKSLDTLLGGGVETQAITEAYGQYGCLTKDAMITLNDGRMVEIGYFAKGLSTGVYPVDIPILTTVNGLIKPSIATNLHVYDCDKVSKVVLENGLNLTATPNHPLLTQNGWKNVEDLTINDHLTLAFDLTFPRRNVKLDNAVKLHKFAAKSRLVKPTLPRELTSQLAGILGYVLAEGSCEIQGEEGGISRVTFANKDRNLLERFKTLVKSVFNVESSSRKGEDCDKSDINSVIVGEFLKQFYGLYNPAPFKFIPPQIFKSPKDVIIDFLSALFDGDGNVKNDMTERTRDYIRDSYRYTYTLPNYSRDINLRSASLKLVEDVQKLLTKFGIISWINSDKKHLDDGRTLVHYRLHISNKSSIIKFYENIGMYTLRLNNDIQKLIGGYKRETTRVWSNLLKIKSIVPTRTLDGKVYDLEVPGTHNFLANNIISHNSGKSQLAFQLAVSVQLPKDKGGLDGACLFVDTENTFRPERIVQIARAMKLEPEKVLRNIYVARAFNTEHQILLIEKAPEMIEEKKIKLIIVDSLTSHFRSDFVGRGELAGRQQKLNRHLHQLLRLGDAYNLAVYITNQVMSDPAMLFGDPTRPVGGNILGHMSTYRLYLRRGKEGTRICKVIDAPNLQEGEAVFRITENGLSDS